MNKACVLLSAALVLATNIVVAQDGAQLPSGSSAGNALPAAQQKSAHLQGPLPPPCYVPPNTTMVAWYDFDEDSGNSFSDLAMANQAIGYPVSNPPTHIVGKVSYALSFNGTDQYVDAPSSIVTNFGPAPSVWCSLGPSGLYSACPATFSFDFWIRSGSGASSGIVSIIDHRSGSPPNIYGYHVFLADGVLGLQLADGQPPAPGYTNYYSPITIPVDNQWHFVAVVIVSRLSTTGLHWYLDGAEQFPESDPTQRTGSLVNDSPVRIGSRTANSPLTGWFDGSLDEVEIYNRALIDAEVQGIYNAGAGGKCKPI